MMCVSSAKQMTSDQVDEVESCQVFEEISFFDSKTTCGEMWHWNQTAQWQLHWQWMLREFISMWQAA